MVSIDKESSGRLFQAYQATNGVSQASKNQSFVKQQLKNLSNNASIVVTKEVQPALG